MLTYGQEPWIREDVGGDARGVAPGCSAAQKPHESRRVAPRTRQSVAVVTVAAVLVAGAVVTVLVVLVAAALVTVVVVLVTVTVVLVAVAMGTGAVLRVVVAGVTVATALVAGPVVIVIVVLSPWLWSP